MLTVLKLRIFNIHSFMKTAAMVHTIAAVFFLISLLTVFCAVAEKPLSGLFYTSQGDCLNQIDEKRDDHRVEEVGEQAAH